MIEFIEISTMEINEDFEVFYADIVENNNSLRVTIPKKIAAAAGYKMGDCMKVWIRKVDSTEGNEEETTDQGDTSGNKEAE